MVLFEEEGFKDCVPRLEGRQVRHGKVLCPPSRGTVCRKVKGTDGMAMLDVKIPIMIKRYNEFMPGVDISDQLISYHRILRQTNKALAENAVVPSTGDSGHQCVHSPQLVEDGMW